MKQGEWYLNNRRDPQMRGTNQQNGRNQDNSNREKKGQDQRDITRKKENDKEDYNNSKFYSRRIEREKISNSEDKTNYKVKWKRQQDNVRVHSTIQNKDGSEEKGKQEVSSILNIIKETMKSLTQNIMKLKEKEVPQEAANIFMEFTKNLEELCKET